MNSLIRRGGTILVVGMMTLAAMGARADERFFTYSYEPKVLPKGALEYEQWATMRNGHEDTLYTRWDIRTEIEAGLTDNLTTAIYMNASNKWEPAKGSNAMYFRGWSSEWKYKLSDPTADPIGVMLYGEVGVDRREWEAEAKLVLGKNIGNVVLAANAIFENEWKTEVDPTDPGEYETETEKVFEGTAGIAYRLGNIALGIEARSHNVKEGDETASALFVGPTFHANSERWWATFTFLGQITDEFEGHERTETRLIFGLHL